jgi:HEPN domain-containing protein
MNNDDLVKAWFAKASSDMRSAEIILATGMDDLPADMVCFHCQQAAEKYLKGFLTSRETEYPLTHSLKALVEKAMGLDNTFAIILEKAESLTPYAVTIKYPDDFRMPSREEAESAFAIASEIKNFVLQRVNPGAQRTGEDE